jgi:hypothetical protein
MLKRFLSIIFLVTAASTAAMAAGDYRGDAKCPPPADWSTYSQPYEPLDHPYDYPTFRNADLPGWSCSYQREDGVTVQYGDSRSPQKQWLDTWGGNDEK